MILTRYIYEKENLEYSVFLALLNKDREQVKFWIYELYYSGFKVEAFILLWEIYYRIYYMCYPNMEKFMKKQMIEWISNKNKDYIIGSIAESMAIRDAVIDVYLENTIQIQSITNINEITKIKSCFTKEDCFTILENLVYLSEKKEYFNKKIENTKKIFLELDILPLDLVKYYSISIIAELYMKIPSVKFKKNIYIILDCNEIKQYKTKIAIKHSGYKMPPRECKYQVKISPEKQKLDYADYDNWVYYASFSPLWRKRIERHNGIIEHEEKKVNFPNEEDEELFYNYFNLEPDEQSLEIEERWFGYKPFDSWNDLYNRYHITL